MAERTAGEIRASIEANRAELAVSVEKLRGEIAEVTDWRKRLHRMEMEVRQQLQRRQREIVIGAAVGGFVLGGGIAAIGGLLRRG